MTLGTVACQAPLSVEFPRQEYWSGLPFPFAGDLPEPGTELGPPVLQADSLLSEPPGEPRQLTEDGCGMRKRRGLEGKPGKLGVRLGHPPEH